MTPEELLVERKLARINRDSKLIELYAMVNKNTGARVYSVRELADQFGMSKSRVHEIVRVVTAK